MTTLYDNALWQLSLTTLCDNTRKDAKDGSEEADVDTAANTDEEIKVSMASCRLDNVTDPCALLRVWSPSSAQWVYVYCLVLQQKL